MTFTSHQSITSPTVPPTSEKSPSLRTEPIEAVQVLTDFAQRYADQFFDPSSAWRLVVSPVFRFLNGSVSLQQAMGSIKCAQFSEVRAALTEIDGTALQLPDMRYFAKSIERLWHERGWYPRSGDLSEYFVFAGNTPVDTWRFHLAEERTRWAISGSDYGETLALYCRGLALTTHLRRLGIHLEPAGGPPVDNHALCQTIGELGARIILWENEQGNAVAASAFDSAEIGVPVNLILRWGLAVMLDLSVHDPRCSIFSGESDFAALWPDGHESAISYYAALAVSELTRTLKDAGIGEESEARSLIAQVLNEDWESAGFRSPFHLNASFTEFDLKTSNGMSVFRHTRERAFSYALPVGCCELGCSDLMPSERDIVAVRELQRRFLTKSDKS